MKIYSYRKNALTNDNEISILELNGLFTAMTFCNSKTFKTFSGAKKWLEKRGWTKIIDIEIIN
jgi:hypothetical protein